MNRDQIAEVIEAELGRFLRGQGEMEFWRARFRLAADAIMALDGWQTIDSAPRDGTWILVYEPGDWEPAQHVVRWGTPEWAGGEDTWVTMALGPNPDTYDVEDATHWKPLDQPPGDAG